MSVQTLYLDADQLAALLNAVEQMESEFGFEVGPALTVGQYKEAVAAGDALIETLNQAYLQARQD